MSSKPTKRSILSPINEALLQYAWKTKSLYTNELVSTEGFPIEIISWGVLNKHEGPDFSDIRIRYKGLIWAGHAEMHVLSSEWHEHKHDEDPNYENVILHVVFEDDKPLYDRHGKKVVTLELKGRIPESVIQNATNLITNESSLSCHNFLSDISAFWINDWKEKQIISRLEQKVNRINIRINSIQGDWEQIAFESIARSMGHGNNADQMELLARICPWKLVRKVIHQREMLEALLFGLAGLILNKVNDNYTETLRANFRYLVNKYQLTSNEKIKWRFMRSRPSNFPTIRIAQFADFLFNKFSLVRTIVEITSINELKKLFKSGASDYWQRHYVFGKLTDKHTVQIGESAIQVVLINACIPLIFAYGTMMGREELNKRALMFLYQLPAERNGIISKWKKAGIQAGSAADSQALLYTFNNYCCSKRCLDCRVGHRIISKRKGHRS
jgi:hypothetical protein